jgi:UDP:flavonoid glycosyltransferase YjiC (YdhE family)
MFVERVTALGFDFIPLGSLPDPVEMRDLHGGAIQSRDPVHYLRRTLPLVVQEGPQMVVELTAACEGADVLVALPYQLAGRIVHELMQIPFITVHLSPFGGYSKKFAAESSTLINELRASYGLPWLEDPLGTQGSSSMLAIYAVSPALFPRPRHWPNHHHMTGFFFFEEEWAPDPSLARFIDSGEPPVVFSFGSVVHGSAEAMGSIVLAAIRKLGRRAVVQRGWTRLQFDAIPSFVYVADFVPHHWLFPKAACAVHSGGAGTTAATLRAGVRSVVVPHYLDQFVWAALLEERGCSSGTVPYPDLTADRLGVAIERALNPDSRNAVHSLSARISSENGPVSAADLIEAHVRKQ